MSPEVITTLKRRILEEIRKLSFRERMLVVVASLAVFSLLAYKSAAIIREKINAQKAEIESLDASRAEVIESLARYSTLRARRVAIEEQYKGVEIKEGVRSHLERLLKEKAGVPSDKITIKELPVNEFGGNYELAPFSIKFAASTMQGLVSFLVEIVHGARPLVLTELELKKGRVGDRMDVSVEVSSIRKVK